MEYPAAIIFLDNQAQFIEILEFCQQEFMDVTELHFHGWHCVVAFNPLSVPVIKNYIFARYGFLPFIMGNVSQHEQ